MITTEEIAIRVFQMLQESEVETMITGTVDYERNDYSQEDVIIIPHTIDGEGSVRYGQINVNIHVPDLTIKVGGKPVKRTNTKRLIEIRAKVIEVLQNHYELGMGYNWTIGRLNPPIKEPDHDIRPSTLSASTSVR